MMTNMFPFIGLLLLLSFILSTAKQKKLTSDGDLLLAAGNGDVNRVKHLIEEEMASLTAKNNYGVSAFIQAANNGHHAVVEFLLSSYPINLEDASNNGKTALHWACYWGHASIVQLLTERGANISTADVHGMTPLMTATLKKHSLIVQYLINQGANALPKNEHGATALMIAQNQQNSELITILEVITKKQQKEEENTRRQEKKKTAAGGGFSFLPLLSYDYWNNYEQDTSPFVILGKMFIREIIFMIEIGKEELLLLGGAVQETIDVIWNIPKSFLFNLSSSPEQSTRGGGGVSSTEAENIKKEPEGILKQSEVKDGFAYRRDL